MPDLLSLGPVRTVHPLPAPVREIKALPAPVSRAAAPGPAYAMTPIGIAGRPQYPATDVRNLQDLLLRSELAWACIDIRATAAASVPLLVEERRGDKWQPIDGHPLRRLLLAPNPEDDEGSLTYAAFQSLDVAGWWFAEVTRAPAQVGAAITGLHPLNPAWTAPVPDNAGGIPRYAYQPDGTTAPRYLDAAQMLVRRAPHPKSRYQGLSRLAVTLGTVDADNAQTDYVRAFFNNSGTVSGILKVKGTYSQAQADVVKNKWRERFGRFFGRQHDVAVLDDNAEYQALGSKLNELDSAILRAISESRVCMVFGVPPLIIYAYIGLLRATYNNLPAAYRGFWETTMTGELARHAAWLQRALLPQFEDPERILAEQVRCRYDFAPVAALQDSADGTQARARENLLAGGITVNEFREIVGQKRDPGGDYYTRRAQTVATRFGTDVADMPAGAGTTGAGDPSGATMDELAARLAKLEAGVQVPVEDPPEPDDALTLTAGRRNGRH